LADLRVRAVPFDDAFGQATGPPLPTLVAREVLPAIRKRGAYMTDAVVDAVLEDPSVALRIALEQKAGRNKYAQGDDPTVIASSPGR
jgi:prophage antirepressor-like protein